MFALQKEKPLGSFTRTPDLRRRLSAAHITGKARCQRHREWSRRHLENGENRRVVRRPRALLDDRDAGDLPSVLRDEDVVDGAVGLIVAMRHVSEPRGALLRIRHLVERKY